MARHDVQLSKDHLERQARCSPERAIEELIWNGLDSGGPAIEVTFELNDLNSATALEVRDYGAGIAFDDLERAFGTIGRSLKNEQRVNPNGRAMHGSEGRGRFRAVVLGSNAEWRTTFRKNGANFSYVISMDRATQHTFTATEPVSAPGQATGTVVRVEGIEKGTQSLLAEATTRYLTQRLALYLNRYPVTVLYNAAALDPRSVVQHHETIPMADGLHLDVIEWSFEVPSRQLLLCDAEGFAWHELSAGVHAKGLSFTAFLRSPNVREWYQDGRFLLGELDPEINTLVSRARDELRGYVRSRLAQEAADLVRQWKDERIYPYSEDEAETPIHTAERQAFDIVASRVHLHHPGFRDSPKPVRQFTLHLVRQALESNPSSLRKILEEVIRLPKAQQDELAELFAHTNLRNIIAASKDVEERLRALTGFQALLFDPDWKRRLRERTQLHRLLVHHLWIFGDEYILDSDDEPMRKVLERHVQMLGRGELAADVDVSLLDGKEGIPDLMLSRSFERDRKRVEHLIIELKRPSRDLSDSDITQIKKYAYTVSEDERFSKENVDWTFILVGNELTPFAKREAQPKGNLPYGCLTKEPGLTIWIKKWSDVLHEARSRYDFFRQRLEIEASSDDGVALLQERHAALMTGKGLTKKQERELAGE
jgi:hypothetical protein